MFFAILVLRWFWPISVFYVVRMFYGRVGLQGLYLTFLEEASPQLSTALKLIAESKDGVVVNCVLGKDRTGTIAALVLLAMEVPTERVCYDYALTGQYLSQDYISAMLKKVNLDTEDMASSNKGTMAQTISYLIINYGSVENYFDRIGFNDEWRSKLRANFTEPIRTDM